MQVIASYDDSHVLKAIGAGAATGAAVRKVEGALMGAGLGLLFAALTSQTRPTGLAIRCPQCTSVYNAHLPLPRMRCPVCNTRLMLAPQ